MTDHTLLKVKDLTSTMSIGLSISLSDSFQYYLLFWHTSWTSFASVFYLYCFAPMAKLLYSCMKWFTFPQLQHVFLKARHCLGLRFMPQYWHSLEFYMFFHLHSLLLHSLFLCLVPYHVKFVFSFTLAGLAFCNLLVSTISAHARPGSHVISLLFLIAVTFLFILDVIALSFMPLLHCSLKCQSCPLSICFYPEVVHPFLALCSMCE